MTLCTANLIKCPTIHISAESNMEIVLSTLMALNVTEKAKVWPESDLDNRGV